MVKRGRGRPFTLFAPGGQGEDLEARMRYADDVAGTKIGFAYEHSEHFAPLAHIPRQAERDAAEARAVASDYQATQAIGFSRGARAVVGALAGPRLVHAGRTCGPAWWHGRGPVLRLAQLTDKRGAPRNGRRDPGRRPPRRPRAPGPSGTSLGRTAGRPLGNPSVSSRLHGPRAGDEPSRRVLLLTKTGIKPDDHDNRLCTLSIRSPRRAGN